LLFAMADARRAARRRQASVRTYARHEDYDSLWSDIVQKLTQLYWEMRGLARARRVVYPVIVRLGSPLVVDLDGDGVRFAAGRVSFDLAAAGEPALIPALEGGDGFLADTCLAASASCSFCSSI
jgi:hypothetical protein